MLAPVGQPQRIGGLILPARHGLEAAADDFGKIGAREQDDGDLRAQQLVDVEALGMNSGNITLAMNNRLTSGTPRISST